MGEERKATANELSELKRVFAYICNYNTKKPLRDEIVLHEERVQRIEMHKRNPDVVKVEHASEKRNLTSQEIEEAYSESQHRLKDIEAEIERIDDDPDKKIYQKDIFYCLKDLGRACTKKDIEDMVWEVDEDLDGCVSWEECELTFKRNVADTTGLEPRQLFDLLQFMIYDKDQSGKVTLDETMEMLYARYGKGKLEEEMQTLFGKELKSDDGDGELDFGEYLKAIAFRSRPKKSSAKGMPPNKSKRKVKK